MGSVQGARCYLSAQYLLNDSPKHIHRDVNSPDAGNKPMDLHVTLAIKRGLDLLGHKAAVDHRLLSLQTGHR